MSITINIFWLTIFILVVAPFVISSIYDKDSGIGSGFITFSALLIFWGLALGLLVGKFLF